MANRPVTPTKIPTIKSVKKDDTVQVITGKFKGRTGKVLSVNSKAQTVTIEGIGEITRHIKPNQFNPRGGEKQVHTGLTINKVKKIDSSAQPKTAKTTKKESK